MTRVNKILLLFLAIVFTSFLVMWEFVQSEFFAGVLSKNVTKYTKELLDADLNFEKIEFKLFPPGIEVNNVLLSKKNKGNLGIYTKVAGLGVSFNPLDLFETDLTIDRLYLLDGTVKVTSEENVEKVENKNSKKNQEKINFKISEVLNTLRAKLPFTLNNIELNKIDVSFNNKSLLTHYANVFLERESLQLDITLRNFNLGKMQLYEEIVDELDLKATIEDDVVYIQNLYISKNMTMLSLQGSVEDYLDLADLEWDVEGSIEGNIAEIHRYLEFKKVGELNQGVARINFGSEGTIDDYAVNAVVEAEDVVTDFANADKLKSQILIDNKNIVFESFDLFHQGGRLTLKKPFEFFNFQTKKFVEENIFVNANEVKLTNALRYLRDSLKILHGKVSGNIEFSLGSKDFHFFVEDGAYVDELKLIVSDDGKSILNPERVKLHKGQFDIWGSDVDIILDADINQSNFTATGSVKKGIVKFDVNKGRIQLSELGKIAGFDIKGLGKFDLSVLVTPESQVLNIFPKVKDFSFEGYQQKELEATVSIDLKNNVLNIQKIKGRLGQTVTHGNFALSFTDLSTTGKIVQEKILVSDIKKIYQPVLADTSFLTEKMYGDWKTEVNISGKLTLDELKVEGAFIGQNSFLYGETLDIIRANYKLENKIFTLSDLYLTKSSGSFHGGMSYGLEAKNLLFWGNLNKIPLTEINNYGKIPTTLTGKLSGVFRGSLQKDKINLNSEISISDSRAHDKKIGNSYFKAIIQDSIVKYDASLLGNIIESRGKIFLNNTREDSEIQWKIDVKDMNQTLSLLNFVDHLKTGFTGRGEAEGTVRFNLSSFKNFSSTLNVRKLYLNKGKINVAYENKQGSQVVVTEGKIKKWDLNVSGSKFYITSKGEGDFNSRYDIKTRMKTDAILLEVFNVLISKASGTLLTSIHNYKTLFDEDYVAKLVSKNLSISSDLAPVTLKKGDLLLNYKKKKIILNKMTAELNSGTFRANGAIDISRVIPDINIRYEFDNAGIPLFKKSSVTFSGKGSFIGKTVPYTLGGEIQVLKCNIVNEVTDFIGGEEVIKTEIDYLPQDNSQILNQFVNFNINVNTREPVRITNSMADLGFLGNVILTGGERDPRLEGKISLAPRKNQIFFKNNTFTLSKGNVFFYQRNKISNPELDFLATSVINKYSVSVSILGQLKEFKMDLASNPVLSQGDVLSLIAFGYTENLSANLSDSEKESMTRAGVGSMIFDRFKINETLKNEFGLQVNLGTQVTQQQGSYLSQKNASGAALGKVHSATTIQIKKKISDAVNMSVMSTVGGTVGPKQSMNINYNLNKNLSLEGVYQTNTQIQADEINNDNSLGADVKIRWSFK